MRSGIQAAVVCASGLACQGITKREIFWTGIPNLQRRFTSSEDLTGLWSRPVLLPHFPWTCRLKSSVLYGVNLAFSSVNISFSPKNRVHQRCLNYPHRAPVGCFYTYALRGVFPSQRGLTEGCSPHGHIADLPHVWSVTENKQAAGQRIHTRKSSAT